MMALHENQIYIQNLLFTRIVDLSKKSIRR